MVSQAGLEEALTATGWVQRAQSESVFWIKGRRRRGQRSATNDFK
jgi:hypothetical protein